MTGLGIGLKDLDQKRPMLSHLKKVDIYSICVIMTAMLKLIKHSLYSMTDFLFGLESQS